MSAVDSSGRTIWIVDAHGYGKRFIVRTEEILTAFVVDTKGKSLEEVASFPALTPEEIAQKAPEREPEPTSGELFDGNIGKLGQVVHDLPFDANDG